MGACAGRHKRTDNESNRKSRRRQWLLSTPSKREEQQRLPNVTNEKNKAPTSTALYDLPLEILDIIFKKSYLHWILNSSEKQRDEEVIRSLTSVDVCFNRRITRQRFKKTIWRYLKDFYGKTKQRSSIIRNNRNYLLENIQPNDELIASLLSLNCITEEQSHLIQRQCLKRDKNAVFLRVLRFFDDTNFSNFVDCLRQAKQTAVALIVENGGVAIKVKVKNRGAMSTTYMDSQLLHQRINDLRNIIKQRSHQTDKLISELKDEGIEILNAQMDRQTVVVWIWCRSQAALENMQRLFESNQLTDAFFDFTNIRPSSSEIIKWNRISIDCSQFKKTVVVCPIFVNYNERIDTGRNQSVCGVTKLGNEIYVLCRSLFSFSFSSAQNVIFVFDDKNSFRLRKKIEIKEIKSPSDIGSSEKETCLYVSDYGEENCVWKITRETDDQHEIIKWVDIDYQPMTLSVSSDDRLLMVSSSSSLMMVYGSVAEFFRSVQLPRDIKDPIHAVETSIGNFIILHLWRNEEKDSGTNGRKKGWLWVVSEVTRDGQMVIRRFIPSNDTQKLNHPSYLSLDSDDRVFVADNWNHRVILLDSDLKWNRIVCPTKEEDINRIQMPWRLCYDEGKKQLIVGDFYLGEGVTVYTLSRIQNSRFIHRY